MVAPGFIDIHNHSDRTVLTDGNAESMVRQGVTSMIFGVNGESAAPSQEYPECSVPDTSPMLLKKGISTNIGSYVGSSQIWMYVRGQKAGPPTAQEIERMQALVRAAMEQGALGVSSSLSGPPGSWIDTNTLIAMCKIASEFGGIYSTHMRTEGQGVFESVAEALRDRPQGQRSGRYHPPEAGRSQAVGPDAGADRDYSSGTCFGSAGGGQRLSIPRGQNNLASIIPPWAHEGGTAAMLARLKDPSLRDRLRDEIQNGIKGSNWYNHYTATGSLGRACCWYRCRTPNTNVSRASG